MNRHKVAYYAVKILGNKTVSRFQSLLKFYLTFRQDYSINKPLKYPDKKRIVFMIDGKTPHGGLSDRLRGLFSVYHYCINNDIDFKVCWDYPFKLQEYLAPKIDWVIDKRELSYNKRETAFSFFNSYSFMNNDETNYFKLLFTNKIEHHVYSNVTLHEELFKRYFNELFTLDVRLESAVKKCLNEIGGRYVSCTFRFIGLLGDFNENVARRVNSEEEKTGYIKKGISAIQKLKKEHPEVKKVLVTADSPLFLKEASKIPYVYIIPGTVAHMDNVEEDDYGVHLKSFLDFILISKALKCYSFTTGRMFAQTKFAKTAALVGGKQLITFSDDTNLSTNNNSLFFLW